MKDGVKIVTYNLRCVWNTVDGINNFIHRAGMIYYKINEEKPDIIGFQEAIDKHRDFLIKVFPEYQLVGHLRGEDYEGEGCFVAVRKDTFELLGYETFWMSPTPYVPGSRYENQSTCPRICVVVKVRHKKTNKILRLFDLHLDHVSNEARENGMKCVFDYVKKFNETDKQPLVILGDFNAQPDSGVMQMCNEFPGITEVTKDITFTFHAFGIKESKIDYIYMSDDLAKNVKSVSTWDDEDNGIYLSDHYPVCAELEF